MKRAGSALAMALTLAGCSGAQAPSSPATAQASTAAASPAPAVTGMARYDGYGDTRFGMDEPAFRRAWKGELAGAAPTDEAQGCHYLWPKGATSPRDFGFMFEHGQFVRYGVSNTKETAPGGGKVGMSVAQIRALYGDRLEQSPHKYDQGAYYLRLAGHGTGVLLFETDDAGTITSWRVGVPPQIDYVEGCS